MKRWWSARATVLFLATVVLALLLQLVPYGRNHSNPSVVREPRWDSPRTRELARRACFDCHSNETNWPWYSNVAPVSWMIFRDVKEGRHELNFSKWRGGERKAERPEKLSKEIRKDKMPPLLYRLAHPEARLTKEEKRELIEGMEATR